MERYQMLYARGHWGRWDRRNFNGALIAGHENNGEPLFLCRTDHNGAMHPGKVVNGRCNIGYGGNEISQPDFELYYEDR
jgi:hypothetical protein